MKKIMIIVLILILVSCEFSYDSPPRTKNSHRTLYVESENIFSVDAVLCLKAYITTPANIYNPNKYSILVSVDGSGYCIPAQSFLKILLTPEGDVFIMED